MPEDRDTDRLIAILCTPTGGEVVNKKLAVAARPMKVKLVECDGGCKDENSDAANVLLSHDGGTLAALILFTTQSSGG